MSDSKPHVHHVTKQEEADASKATGAPAEVSKEAAREYNELIDGAAQDGDVTVDPDTPDTDTDALAKGDGGGNFA